MRNPFYKGGTVWYLYRFINKDTWQLSWNSLLYYHNFKFTTENVLKWFIRFKNDKEYFIVNLFGFTFIYYKSMRLRNKNHGFKVQQY